MAGCEIRCLEENMGKIAKPRRPNGWHFIQPDKRLQFADRRRVRCGVVQTMRAVEEQYWGEAHVTKHTDPILCAAGMHASAQPLDALQYCSWGGAIACRVAVWGDVVSGEDKFCGRHRLVFWMVDADRVLHRFAVWCARRALRIAGVTDKRSHEALRVKLLWLDGGASDSELHAAWAAAWAAAWDAVRGAAGDAARGAAWAAAGAAAWDAAWDAAWAAAGGAAWAAAGAAERKTQNRKLAAMLGAEHRRVTRA